MHRVVELANYAIGRKSPTSFPYKSVLSLDKILSEIIGTGPTSKQVQREYYRLLSLLGPELLILLEMPLDNIQKHGSGILSEAIRRIRNGKIHASPGFDGQYGTIHVFTDKERNDYSGQTTEYDIPAKKEAKSSFVQESNNMKSHFKPPKEKHQHSEKLNDAQQEAVKSSFGPLLVIAGPGRLITEKFVSPQAILAVTFSNRAAQEMANRIETILSRKKVQKRPEITTFHKLGLKIIIENCDQFELKKQPMVLSEEDMIHIFSHIVRQTKNSDNTNVDMGLSILSIFLFYHFRF